MSDIDGLDVGQTAETGDLSVDAVEFAGGVEHAEPGFGIIGISHIVVGVIAGNDHQGPQDNVLVTGGGNSFDHRVAGGLFGLAFNGADENVLIAESVHLGLHLGVGHFGGVGSAVAHEYEGGAGSIQLFKRSGARVLDGSGDDGLGGGFLVGVDHGSVRADFTQPRSPRAAAGHI